MENSERGTAYMRVGEDDGELRPWYYTYVYSIESKLVLRIRYDSGSSENPKNRTAALPSLKSRVWV